MTSNANPIIIHNGGCHCGHVKWQVETASSVIVWECNCSDCSMRGNIHFVVPRSKFKLLGESEHYLTTYTFGTHMAKHTFCKICGITSFYIPRSNPDGIAVTYKCVDPGTLKHVEIRTFDGKNWERSYEQTSIGRFSKSDQ
ncbi:S-(hydroxymethyl)glutathione synthase [Zostera marina]|uniref:S-(Hydroxymethyl)glutathione synthase n=1 Tax=Zostera marina TaxID=29655 RepID=A0A0K9PQD3_ZOSMR|nr:S-(hydroxymethyl)glutathione synthase [Zostera marina]